MGQPKMGVLHRPLSKSNYNRNSNPPMIPPTAVNVISMPSGCLPLAASAISFNRPTIYVATNAIHSPSPLIGMICVSSRDRKKQMNSPHNRCTYLSLPKWHSQSAKLSYILKTFFILLSVSIISCLTLYLIARFARPRYFSRFCSPFPKLFFCYFHDSLYFLLLLQIIFCFSNCHVCGSR